MTPQIATTTFTTEFVELPPGVTPAEGFQADMYKDGAFLSSQQVPTSAHHATFTLTEAGTYYSTVTRFATDGTSLGSASSEEFVLEDDGGTTQVEVPVSVTNTLVPAVATPKNVKVNTGPAKATPRRR